MNGLVQIGGRHPLQHPTRNPSLGGPPHQEGRYKQLADWLFVRSHEGSHLLIRSFPFRVVRLTTDELHAVQAHLSGAKQMPSELGEYLQQHHFFDGEPDPQEHLNRHVSAILLVTTACNLTCPGCFASGGDYGMGVEHMSKEVIDATIGYLCRQLEALYKADGFTSDSNLGLHFFGGEPFIVFDRVQYAVEQCCREASALSERLGRRVPPDFFITTNGTLLKPNYVEFLKQYDFSVLISIDGPKHDERRAYRSGQGSLAAALRTFQELQAAGIKTRINTVVLDEDIEDFPSMLKWFKDEVYQGEPSLSVYHTFSFQREGPALTVGACGAYSPNIVAKYADDLRGFNAEGYRVYEVALLKKILTGGTFYKCSSGVKRIAIGPTGRVYPCQGFVDGTMDMGSILDPAFQHRASIPSLQLAKRNIATLRPCRDCVFSALCPHNVDCAARSHYTLGGIAEIDVNGMCRVGFELMDRILFESDFLPWVMDTLWGQRQPSDEALTTTVGPDRISTEG